MKACLRVFLLAALLTAATLRAQVMDDTLFGGANYAAAKKLLDVAALQHEAHACNLANVETPGYKRVDIDPSFEAALKDAYQKGDINAIEELPVDISEDKTALAVRPDGNNVNMETELMMDNETAVNYDSLEQYLSTDLNQLQQAMRPGN